MKQFVILIILVSIVTSGLGQYTDFSGKWKLKEKEADGQHPNSLALNTLVVKQTKDTISLKKNFTWDGEEFNSSEKYTLDGKVSKNPPDADQAKTSTAVWEQNNTVLKITSSIPLDWEEEAIVIEEFMMIGDNLVIKSSATSPDGELVEQFVLERQ